MDTYPGISAATKLQISKLMRTVRFASSEALPEKVAGIKLTVDLSRFRGGEEERRRWWDPARRTSPPSPGLHRDEILELAQRFKADGDDDAGSAPVDRSPRLERQARALEMQAPGSPSGGSGAFVVTVTEPSSRRGIRTGWGIVEPPPPSPGESTNALESGMPATVGL